jgi:hypothetical protein
LFPKLFGLPSTRIDRTFISASAGSEEKNSYRFDPSAEHIRRLESGAVAALGTLLAGLLKFVISFCEKWKSGRRAEGRNSVFDHAAECDSGSV